MLHSHCIETKCIAIITADGTLHKDASLTISHTLQIHLEQVSLEFSHCDCFIEMPSTKSKGTLHRISSPTAFVYLPALDQHTLHQLQSFFNPISLHTSSLQSMPQSQLECMYWIETLLIDVKGRPKRKLGRPRKSSLGMGDICLDLSMTHTLHGTTNSRPSIIAVSSGNKSKFIKFIKDPTTAEPYTTNSSKLYNDTRDANLIEEKERQCLECNRRHTPLWRRGPMGTGTLCNACGVKWNKQLKQQHTGSSTSPNDSVNNSAGRRYSVVFSSNLTDNERQEHPKSSNAQERRPSAGNEVESMPVIDNLVKGQVVNQKPKEITFIAPLKKRKVILD